MRHLGREEIEALLAHRPPWPWIKKLPWLEFSGIVLCFFVAAHTLQWLERLEWADRLPSAVPLALRFVFPILAVALGVRAALRTVPLVHELADGEFRSEKDEAKREEVMCLREQGRIDEAFALLEAQIKRSAVDLQELRAYWEVALACCKQQQALSKLIEVCQTLLERGKEDAVLELWLEMSRTVNEISAPPRLLIKVAALLLQEGHQELGQSALRGCLEEDGAKSLTPGLALRIVELAREPFPELAARAARQAIRAEELDEAKRDRLVHLLKSLEKASAQRLEAAVSEPHEQHSQVAKKAPESPTAAGWKRADAIPIDLDEDDMSQVLMRQTATPAPVVDGLEYDPEAIASMEAEMRHDDEFASPEIGMTVGLGEDSHADLEAAPVTIDLNSQPNSGFDAATMAVDTKILGATPVAERDPLTGARLTQTTTSLASLGKVFGEFEEEEVDFEESPPAPRFGELKVMEAKPRGLSPSGLRLQLSSGRDTILPFAQVSAVAVAAIAELASDGLEVVVDLALDWNRDDVQALRVVRLRWRGIDRSAMSEGGSPALDFLESFVRKVLEQVEAALLPPEMDRELLAFPTFPDLKTYYRQVLRIEC